MKGSRPTQYDLLKRALDITGALLLLALLWPLLLLVAALVVVNLGRPVLFTQPRPGLGARVFRLYKFRSMRNVDLKRGRVTDAERLTRFGRALRASSLDELPSLINVARGDMSFVGPRPLLVDYLERYSPEQARRHEVRPGITGLAQVNGRNALSWDERFRLDVQYVESRSLPLDLRILLGTVKSVVTRDGISETGQATMSEFRRHREQE